MNRGRFLAPSPEIRRTSTVLFDSVAHLEGAAGVVLGPSGLSAISTALLSIVRTGDHLLVVDTVYGPARELCDGVLARLGVTTAYCDPLIGAGIADLIRPNTSGIWMESPGSHTFEFQDAPAIVAAARAADHRVVTMFDNTWGSPGLFRPFDHGIGLDPADEQWAEIERALAAA